LFYVYGRKIMSWVALVTMSADETTMIVAAVVLGGVSLAFLIVLGRMLWHCCFENPYESLASGDSGSGDQVSQDPEPGNLSAQVATVLARQDAIEGKQQTMWTLLEDLQATLAHIGASPLALEPLETIPESNRELVRHCVCILP
jgi:hypothetical protein